MQKKVKIVETLLDSLPFIKHFNGAKMVIKYGGSAQINPDLKNQFAIDIVLMYLVGIKPIIVHGGGKRINEVLDIFKIESQFKDGLRVTCGDTMKIVEMVLSGEINKEIVSLLNRHGAKAIGISGKDGNFLEATAKNEHLGYTGKITDVNSSVLTNIIDDGYVPVVAPIASSKEDNHPGFNINADSAASIIASKIGAKRVIFLTDTPGVLDENKNLIPTLNEDSVKEMISSGTINGGMIPKVEACLEAIDGGVEKAHIIDGRVEHSLLLELFTSEGVGSEIIR